MKISTKKGDKGETSLINGAIVSKDDIRIETCGTVDELNSILGMSLTAIKDNNTRKIISTIQHKLFVIGSELALPLNDTTKNLPELKKEDLNFLEENVNNLEKKLPELKEFILPGGEVSAAIIGQARSVCRRAERRLVTYIKEFKIHDHSETKREKQILLSLKYLNRLSDLFFLLSRERNISNNCEEIKWNKNI